MRTWAGHAFKETYAHLFSFTKKPKCSLRFFFSNEENIIFSLPMSTQAAEQLTEIQTLLQEGTWDGNNIDDVWTYIWGNARYSTKKTYKILIRYIEASPLFSWMWGSSNLGKHKFFFWLLLRDRLSRRNLLRWKNMTLDDYSCVLCNRGLEDTCFHLFFECPFSQECWDSIPITWNLNLPPLDMVIIARTNFGLSIFREFFITACWVIWTTRNAVIFDNGQVNVNTWKLQFREELGLVCTKAKQEKSASLSVWKDSYM